MTARRRKSGDEALLELCQRLDVERHNIERAASLLRILAEHVQEDRHSSPGEAWYEAEYLGNRMGEHVEALAKVSDDLDGFRIRTKYPDLKPPRPRLEIVPADGDAA